MIPLRNRKSAAGNPPPTVRAPVLDPTYESAGLRFPRATQLFRTIKGEQHYLWRAVDQDGNVLDMLVQSRRNKQAAKKFFRKLLKGCQYVPG